MRRKLRWIIVLIILLLAGAAYRFLAYRTVLHSRGAIGLPQQAFILPPSSYDPGGLPFWTTNTDPAARIIYNDSISCFAWDVI